MTKVQFNLLPPSKMKAIQVRSQQDELTQKILKASFVCLALFVLSGVYTYGIQRSQIKNAGNGIQDKAVQLQKVQNLSTIITVQNQLQTASQLHQSQHDTSRIFDYMAKLTPLSASVSGINLDLAQNTIKIDGVADSATTVNAFIDALKTAQYQVNGNKANAFSAVVEDNFALTQNSATFSLNAKFDPLIFANNIVNSNGQPQLPTLIVPNSTTVHSNDPGSLFGGSQ